MSEPNLSGNAVDHFRVIPEPENPIRFLEELSLNAWPAPQTVYDDGWVLRFGEGYTRRANSVNPLYTPHSDLDDHIRRCEAWYRIRKQDAIFKMTPLALPKELDKVLIGRGYREEATSSVQMMDLHQLATPDSSYKVVIAPELSDEWLDLFGNMRAIDNKYTGIMRRIMSHIVPASAFAVLYVDQAPAAVGLAVAERGNVGLFNITTHPDMRNRGLGEQIILHLLNWGKTQGAAHSYLEVMIDNPFALRLYEKLGYREIYQYWFRVKSQK
jgi:ribosomal protein S18 acetylase RimI-like enzyme